PGLAEGFGEAAAEDDIGQGEEGDGVGDGASEQVGGFVDDGAGEFVAFGVGGADDGGSDVAEWGAFAVFFLVASEGDFGEVRGVVLLDECGEAVGDGGARADIFEESVGERGGGEEEGLADLAGGAEAAVVEASVEDESAADAGAAPHAE